MPANVCLKKVTEDNKCKTTSVAAIFDQGRQPQLVLFQVFNASAELNDVTNYPYLRLFTVADKSSLTQKYDLMEVEEKWSLPSKGLLLFLLLTDRISLVARKPVFGVSDQVRHKPGCTAAEDG